jgi:flagellar protein FliS
MNDRHSIYLEQEVLSASPVQLVHLLYQAAIARTRDARRALANNDIAVRCAAISKTCNIVGELRSSLDFTTGGEIAARLDALYGYMLCRLLDANLKKTDEPLSEVLGLLVTMDEGWKQIAEAREPEPTPVAARHHYAMAETSEAHAWSA